MAAKTYHDLADSGVDELRIAIVRQAVDDYRRAKRKLHWEPGDYLAQGIVAEIERFIQSKWFEILVDIDQDLFLEKLREEKGKWHS